ncbi:MAG TPA: 6,7-dimethyl-8-ribityllumazine synthase [Thermoanaerobaculia bacterium]|nr:6,7-dimethyl-8-ribityllumazine synthase [Thermoanaerobaculia bacterium]
MSQERPLPAAIDGAGLRVAVVAARFNGEVVDRLLAGAIEVLDAAGVVPADRIVLRVPGAWEIPIALEALAHRGQFDALVALGAVIRGETAHFDFVAGECSRGAMDVALRHRVPVGFGLLTCDTREQALARAGGVAGNKGAEAARAALETFREIGRRLR